MYEGLSRNEVEEESSRKHLKPDFINMTFDALALELKMMFGHRQSRMTTRRKFETRAWKRDETFHEYVHEKIIMGNRVPIETDEMLDYIIDGIPDNVLRNQAHIQRFKGVESLLEAFEAVTLRNRCATISDRPGKRSEKSATNGREDIIGRSAKDNDNNSEKKKTNIKRCFNCGACDHVNKHRLSVEELGLNASNAENLDISHPSVRKMVIYL